MRPKSQCGRVRRWHYANRTDDPLGLDLKSTTFVFVTPNRFANKVAWEKAKLAEGIWRDVRVVDADILVHWLEICPAVAYRLWLDDRDGLNGPRKESIKPYKYCFIAP